MKPPKKNVMLRIDAALLEKFDKYAQTLHMSKSAFIEDMLRSTLDDCETLFKGETITFNDIYRLMAETSLKLVNLEKERIYENGAKSK